MIWRFLADRSGASSIEYAMVGALISIVIVVAATSIGGKLNALFLGPVLAGFR